MKFIFDESGAKSKNDQNEDFGVVAGFFLENDKIEKELIEKVNIILRKYDILEKVKKIHISEIMCKDKEQGVKIKEEIFKILNELEICWTFSVVSKKDNTEGWVCSGFFLPNFLELLYIRVLVHVLDYNINYCKNDKIELITDNVDKKIIKDLQRGLKSLANDSPIELVNTVGYDKENKKPIVDFKIIANGPPVGENLMVLKDIDIKTEISVLTFIADILVGEAYKVLKNSNIEKYNNRASLSKHPCKNLFMISENCDEAI